jgi:hypothetical protein
MPDHEDMPLVSQPQITVKITLYSASPTPTACPGIIAIIVGITM